jgi:hypothetical protein
MIESQIKQNLKTLKLNKPYLTENQLIATACVLQDLQTGKHTDFQTVKSIYDKKVKKRRQK